MSYEEIIACIDNVKTGSEKVNPDGNVIPLNPEDNDEDSGNVYYDVLIQLKTKALHPDKIYVDAEAQNAYNKKYTIPERGIYYCARMLSRQGKEEITLANHEYKNIRKVYSVWICPNVPKYCANTITKYEMSQNLVCGSIPRRYEKNWKSNRYDLLAVIVICIDENQETDNELIGMLSVLLSNRLSAEEKKRRLREEYGIETSSELGKDIEEMTNLSIGLVENTRKEERKKAKEEKNLALEEKEKDAIRNSYDLLCEANDTLTKEDLIERIAKKFRKSIDYVSSVVL